MRRSLLAMALLVGGVGADSGGCGSSDQDSEAEAAGIDDTSGAPGGAYTATGGGGGDGLGGGAPPPGRGTDSNDMGTAPSELASCEGFDPASGVHLFLSADDSNSMASPAHARELLRLGLAPKRESLRTYEFLNYYRIDYPAPQTDDLSVVPELAATPVPGDYDLQIGIRAHDPVVPRRPMNLTFVVDTSGSMSGSSLERARAAIVAIGQTVAEGDVVSLVTWNSENSVVLERHTVTGPGDAVVLAAASELVVDGGSDLYGGLVRGYDLAKQNFDPQRLNRVVLISDGGANVGTLDAQLIAAEAAAGDEEGIYLVGIGTGPANGYNDRLMDAVTDRGRGAYVYLDGTEEAARMFVDRFDEVMDVAARSVEVKLELPWYFEVYRFYGEEISADPSEIEPQHLAPGDAMALSQVLRACSLDVVDPEDEITIRVSWQTPLTHELRSTVVTKRISELMAAPAPSLVKGKAIVAYAEALKLGTSDAVHAARDAVKAADPTESDPELAEIAGLLELHPAY